jgi:Ca2+-binding EF-hand superfamily protein
MRGDEIIAKHPNIAPTLKKIFDATQHPSVQTNLIAGFKRNDIGETGQCHKDDFVNAIFESIKGVKPSELIQIVNAVAEEFEENINYEEFLAMVDRHGGEFGGHEFKFQQTASERNMSRGGVTQEHRELVGRVKQALSQAIGGIVGVEQAMRKFGQNGGVSINFDQFLVALSRVDASLTLEEIKEFFGLVQGNQSKAKGKQE